MQNTYIAMQFICNPRASMIEVLTVVRMRMYVMVHAKWLPEIKFAIKTPTPLGKNQTKSTMSYSLLIVNSDVVKVEVLADPVIRK